MLAKLDHNFQLISETPWVDDTQMKRVGSNIFDLTNGGLSVSADNGDSWNLILSGVPGMVNRKLFVDEVGQNVHWDDRKIYDVT